MLYMLQELQRATWAGLADLAHSMAGTELSVPSANAALVRRLGRRYPKPRFAIAGFDETIVRRRPFVDVVHFAAQHPRPPNLPRVLVVAPLSGHHATLLRDTVATLLADHDVWVTDWRDAREVALADAPTFTLADYVAEIRAMFTALEAPHVVAVCQPTVPVLAAVALDAADGRPTPPSLTLMGGPIDARIAPTSVDELATRHAIDWFERMLIHRVPRGFGFAGEGRRVYPGFLQLSAFVSMNPFDHLRAYSAYWFDHLRGDRAAVDKHEAFYDEYNAVLDMDASYYLDTVRVVFQEFALARGTWRIGGQLVEPAAIARTRLLVVEGERDDISGVGQTAAALALCSGLAADDKAALVATGVGHYGLFAGSRWRSEIYPTLRAHIAR